MAFSWFLGIDYYTHKTKYCKFCIDCNIVNFAFLLIKPIRKKIHTCNSSCLGPLTKTITDLNLDGLKLNSSTDGKPLNYVEDIFEITCIISEHTRISLTSRTLIDAILTSEFETAKKEGVIDFGRSVHALIYTFLKPRVKHHAAKAITFRNIKNLGQERFFVHNKRMEGDNREEKKIRKTTQEIPNRRE